jgi:hypothetical protein
VCIARKGEYINNKEEEHNHHTAHRHGWMVGDHRALNHGLNNNVYLKIETFANIT